jgi:hypothetical protein
MPLYLVQAMIASISLVLMLAALYATLLWYVDAVEQPKMRRYLSKFCVGTAHFLAHLVVMFTLSLLVVSLNNQMAGPIATALDSIYQSREAQAPIVRDVIQEGLEPLQHRQAELKGDSPVSSPAAARPPAVRELVGFVSYPALMIGLGALFGGSLWGLYWVLTGIFGRMHSEQAFAALRIKNYKNFLRLKFEQDKLTIYPLGIDKVPGPDGWLNVARGKANPLAHNPKLIAARPIDVRLIENPIVIARSESSAE